MTDGSTIRLRDGRMLGYAEQGDPEGVPVLVFHGLPGSRFSRHPDGEIARRLHVHVFTFDRPGIGLSSPQPRRRILDWPRDVAEFADARGLDRFAVVGWSGGAPYALATAHELPERVTRVGLVAPVVPLTEPAVARGLSSDLRRSALVGRVAPWAVTVAVARQARAFARDPEGMLERLFANGPECDRRVLDDPQLRQMLVDSRREAFRQGARALAADALLYLRPWGFDPADVRVPVRLWHGEEDATLAPAMGRHVASSLANCEATFLPGEGHMVCVTRWEEILRGVAS